MKTKHVRYIEEGVKQRAEIQAITIRLAKRDLVKLVGVMVFVQVVSMWPIKNAHKDKVLKWIDKKDENQRFDEAVEKRAQEKVDEAIAKQEAIVKQRHSKNN